MIYRILGYGVLSLAVVSGLAVYRQSLIQDGYNAAVTDYQSAEKALKAQHEEKLKKIAVKNMELENENTKKKLEVSGYRSKFAAASERLRQQDANLSKSVGESSCEGVRRYAKEVSSNLAGCRVNLERFGLEAASCSVAAETLNMALDLTHWQGAE